MDDCLDSVETNRTVNSNYKGDYEKTHQASMYRKIICHVLAQNCDDDDFSMTSGFHSK
jgi:hypothetical protein